MPPPPPLRVRTLSYVLVCITPETTVISQEHLLYNPCSLSPQITFTPGFGIRIRSRRIHDILYLRFLFSLFNAEKPSLWSLWLLNDVDESRPAVLSKSHILDLCDHFLMVSQNVFF